FTFADPNRNLELNPPEIERLCQTIERVVLGKLNVANLLASRRPSPAGKAKPDIRPVVHVDNQVSDHATLVEISAEDRPGLLFDLASTISQTGCNIEVVLIDTEAHKAIDVFYLTREDRKLSAEESVALERRLDEVCRRFSPAAACSRGGPPPRLRARSVSCCCPISGGRTGCRASPGFRCASRTSNS
ncbi:MAG: ACT domain-containing protein, partial [Acidobacteriota bacterium]